MSPSASKDDLISSVTLRNAAGVFSNPKSIAAMAVLVVSPRLISPVGPAGRCLLTARKHKDTHVQFQLLRGNLFGLLLVVFEDGPDKVLPGLLELESLLDLLRAQLSVVYYLATINTNFRNQSSEDLQHAARLTFSRTLAGRTNFNSFCNGA